ncbi:DNA-binding transcriptional regulator, LysR family [Humidesulfovibrio mexicanus]|uniref:DNA-binding transcriptional regulator, LysR family n=1 Tax=Humidesulfovibrio mexicanus TaxID=147047 RepID=A0A238YEY9_9BACT|nr:LysR family transcriptional regulator [Humidesulfovibrio mexicanus]SNR69358.1 DNA-binding transcriptional regulator, LysR family [Humidesulfovibrio mexicanus]
MELYQLRTFVAVARAGHLTRAAEGLHVSQPAVSAHIKALEDELGVALFTRSARGMGLTPQGQALLARAQSVLEQAEELTRAARSLRQQLDGELKIALNTDAEFLRVRELLSVLRAEHPALGVHLPQNMSHFIAEEVRAGSLDGGFVYGEAPPQGLEAVPLCSFRLVVIGPLAWRERLAGATWADLAREPWVWYSDALPCHASVQRWIAPYECRLSKVAVTDYEGTIRALVQSGAGLGIMREDEGARCEGAGEAFVWRGDSLPMNAYFLYRRDRESDPAMRAVLAALRAVWGLEQPLASAHMRA